MKMIGLVSIAAYLLSCCSLQAAQWTILMPRSQSENEVFCSPQQVWCASLQETEHGSLALVVRHGSLDVPETADLGSPDHDFEDYQVWREIYEAGPRQILAGVLVTESKPYSGGGASAQWLTLFRFTAGETADAREVLRVPLGGNVVIRACFDEDDVERRLSACHDEYDFSASLDLVDDKAAPWRDA